MAKDINKNKEESMDYIHCSLAFCDSPIHDFDNCPLIKQTNNCKNCNYYN